MTDTLKPCPFCGPRDELSGEWPQLFEHSSDCLTEWSVRCGCCAIELGGEDREEVIALWNTRIEAQASLIDEAVGVLEELSLAAGNLNVATDSLGYFRRHREAVLSAMEKSLALLAKLKSLSNGGQK